MPLMYIYNTASRENDDQPSTFILHQLPEQENKQQYGYFYAVQCLQKQLEAQLRPSKTISEQSDQTRAK